MDRIAYVAPLLLYGLVAFVHLLPGVFPKAEEHRKPLGIVAVIAHAVALVLHMRIDVHGPGLPDALSAIAFGVMVAWLVLAQGRMKSTGIALTPLATVMLGTAMVLPHRQVAALADATHSPWFPVHLGLTFAGLAGFALSFGVGVLYLVARRRLKTRTLGGFSLPPLEWLDRLQFRATLFGFVFLTLGIAAGGIWAAAVVEEPWAYDPKVLVTVALWLWYGVALQARLVAGMRGRWSALMGITGFCALLVSMVALRFIGGFHGAG